MSGFSRHLALCVVVGLGAVACSDRTTPAASVAAPPTLPTPTVIMQADPPPPFTYWAPEGATIRNHPNVPGIWLAYVADRNVATYFGDACRASTYQHLIGQPLEAMPATLTGIEVRTACVTCPVNDDLRSNRINVLFDEATKRIEKIACY